MQSLIQVDIYNFKMGTQFTQVPLLVDDLLAWQEQTQSIFKRRMLPGNHFFLHDHRLHLILAVFKDLTNLHKLRAWVEFG